ncbi:MAG: hypothetical protein MUF54_08810, partial [Polyangiaceae bacterium]|nr:hypothetical protein [Polyangiaceae bacterium]
FAGPVVELFNQHPSSNTPIATTKDIILSVHAVTVRGGKYDPLGSGISDGMALARGVYTIENKVKDVVIQREHKVEQYKLKMSGDDIRTYTRSFAKNSPERVFTASYHTFGRNCGTELLQVFMEAFPERNYPPPASLADTDFERLNEEIQDTMQRVKDGRLLPDIIPSMVRPALEQRGVFDAPTDPWSTDPSVKAVEARLRGQ